MGKTIYLWNILILFIASANGQSLKIFHNTLYYQKNDTLVEVKRIEDCSEFQGYDIVDSTHIFIAYLDDCGEASTDIIIYDTELQKEISVGWIPGTGESTFRYNRMNDLVLFNWEEGLYTFKLHEPQYEKSLTKIIPTPLFDCMNCYIPFWVDSNTIGYLQYIDSIKVCKTIKIQ